MCSFLLAPFVGVVLVLVLVSGMSWLVFVVVAVFSVFRQSIPDFVFGPFLLFFFTRLFSCFFFFVCHRATDLFVVPFWGGGLAGGEVGEGG